MTTRLYYHDSFLYHFDAHVERTVNLNGRLGLILDRTAFYPTSGGQVFDTGWIVSSSGLRLPVHEVAETEDGEIIHYLETPDAAFDPGSPAQGTVDASRRRDHMQQHSGQHLLSAAFVELFAMPTVSFHMGEDYCTIDLDTAALSPQQLQQAERLANEVIFENRPVHMRFVTLEEARALGLRKLPPARAGQLRLIDLGGFDLTACGGTHVASTAQIGGILLRKAEKTKQGWRVEFVCGLRAVSTARADFSTLTESAALFSAHIRDLPHQIRKTQEELRSLRKSAEQLLEQVADFHAGALLEQTPDTRGRKVVARSFADRDLAYIKLLAQRITRRSSSAVALLAATSGQPSLVFAASAGQPFDMGALMKQALAQLGGRGGGSREMAQGGIQNVESIPSVLDELAREITALCD
jgi:alanyl-tRNA synthetase